MTPDYPRNGGPEEAQPSGRAHDDLKEQVAELRADVQELVGQVKEVKRSRVAPAAASVASRVEGAGSSSGRVKHGNAGWRR